MGDVTYFVCESKKQLDALERVPIGAVLDNTIIYLLDADFRPVKSGEIGELYVSGDYEFFMMRKLTKKLRTTKF